MSIQAKIGTLSYTLVSDYTVSTNQPSYLTQ
nr:MAG TPA: hypothetical protein [Caudoviricetes sp.]